MVRDDRFGLGSCFCDNAFEVLSHRLMECRFAVLVNIVARQSDLLRQIKLDRFSDDIDPTPPADAGIVEQFILGLQIRGVFQENSIIGREA